MTKDNVTIIEIGTSKITGVVASRGVNGTFNIITKQVVDYEGYYEGEFVVQDRLGLAFDVLFSQIRSIYKNRISKIFVGVPAEFSNVICTSAVYNFNSIHIIKNKDLTYLFDNVEEKIKDNDVEVISVTPISYVLDDGRKVYDPIGNKASKISADISVVTVDKEFISFLNKLFTKYDIEQVEYLSEPLCESLFVLSPEDRERTCVLINVGALTTDISFVRGNGIIFMTSFSLGGEHITKDLSEAFDLSFDDAFLLKKKIVMSLEGGEDYNYEFSSASKGLISIPQDIANEVIAYRLEIIANAINECIKLYSNDNIKYFPVYLTGAGITKIKGGKDFVASCLNRHVNYGIPPIPTMDKPEYASMCGLLNSALN